MTETYFTLMFMLAAFWLSHWWGFWRGKNRAIEMFETERKRGSEVR